MSSHSAAGPAAGYLFQLERALYWLAKSSSGAKVGIETADDVAVIDDVGNATLEQDKHSIQHTGAPFGDGDSSLWKPLSIWSEKISSGVIDVERTAFYLVTNRPVPECLARQLSDANDAQAAKACVQRLRKQAAEVSEGNAKFAAKVVALSDDDLERLVCRITVLDSLDSVASQPLRDGLRGELHLRPSENAELILNSIVGWLLTTVLSLWRAGQPAWISGDAFANALDEIRESQKRQRRRERAESLVPVADADLTKHHQHTFVEQVRLVSDDADDVEDAITSFVRAEKERFRLSSEGEVLQDEWDAFFARLKAFWKQIRKIHLLSGTSEDERRIGARILAEVLRHRESLAGQPTEEFYLSNGAYHTLADSREVGWHPGFEALLAAAEKK